MDLNPKRWGLRMEEKGVRKGLSRPKLRPKALFQAQEPLGSPNFQIISTFTSLETNRDPRSLSPQIILRFGIASLERHTLPLPSDSHRAIRPTTTSASLLEPLRRR
ncbi:hypothetical protein V8G54_032212 [Vigna mungo]|uniref:Uncharacterized protein n=1 Tax=Vigna mungo TaxID=3915 RepID=A0AAQ3MM01_VIGMU